MSPVSKMRLFVTKRVLKNQFKNMFSELLKGIKDMNYEIFE